MLAMMSVAAFGIGSPFVHFWAYPLRKTIAKLAIAPPIVICVSLAGKAIAVPIPALNTQKSEHSCCFAKFCK